MRGLRADPADSGALICCPCNNAPFEEGNDHENQGKRCIEAAEEIFSGQVENMTSVAIRELLGSEADDLLGHKCETIPKELLQLPGPDFVDRVVSLSDRSIPVMRSLQRLFDHGRLGGTGYLSILPVDQGIEHSAGASFAPNPMYFDPENLVKLAMEGGCNAFASTLGAIGSIARRYAHRIPFIVKLNHNELLTYPNRFDQVFFGQVRQAFDMGAAAVGATIYFGSPESTRQIQEVSAAFKEAHGLGMATVLWAYLRNPAFQTAQADYHLSADLTGQANHIAATLEADIVKQKQAENNGGYTALKFGKTHPKVYESLTSPHPIDLTRYQVINCFSGRAGLINSGGASGKNDMGQAVRTAVINKRAGGMGMISGRKAFQKPFGEGVALLHAIQDVYLEKEIALA
ncbi:MAG: Fructose-bisphosphate aldolase [Fibrobacteres bacterium]|nr:Fructose-bisphosphate aldolase [Fibrobacterota bacterium]